MCVCVCVCVYVCVTLDHKTSHKGQFFEIEIHTLSASLINKLSMMYGLFYDRTIFGRDYNYLKIWNLRVQKNLNTEENHL